MIDRADLLLEIYPEPIKGGMTTGKPPVGVRVTHLPTGTIAACNTERSQHLNRKKALEAVEWMLL